MPWRASQVVVDLRGEGHAIYRSAYVPSLVSRLARRTGLPGSSKGCGGDRHRGPSRSSPASRTAFSSAQCASSAATSRGPSSFSSASRVCDAPAKYIPPVGCGTYMACRPSPRSQVGPGELGRPSVLFTPCLGRDPNFLVVVFPPLATMLSPRRRLRDYTCPDRSSSLHYPESCASCSGPPFTRPDTPRRPRPSFPLRARRPNRRRARALLALEGPSKRKVVSHSAGTRRSSLSASVESDGRARRDRGFAPRCSRRSCLATPTAPAPPSSRSAWPGCPGARACVFRSWMEARAGAESLQPCPTTSPSPACPERWPSDALLGVRDFGASQSSSRCSTLPRFRAARIASCSHLT